MLGIEVLGCFTYQDCVHCANVLECLPWYEKTDIADVPLNVFPRALFSFAYFNVLAAVRLVYFRLVLVCKVVSLHTDIKVFFDGNLDIP